MLTMANVNRYELWCAIVDIYDQLPRTPTGLQRSIKAADVVNAARSADSSLHALFDWTATEAARRYRAEQLVKLARSAAPGLSTRGDGIRR